jgi:hypothetical protein
MSIELKIKSKHLSEEARIIRFEERKLFKQYQWSLNKYRAAGNNDMYPRWDDKAFMSYDSLNRHRRWDVRNENRATFIARAYLSGIPYNQVEQKRKPENEYTFQWHILPRVASMVAKYGSKKIQKKIWEGSFGNRKEVTNPEYTQLENDLKEWSSLQDGGS